MGPTLVLAPASAAVLDRLASLASAAGYDQRVEGPLLVVNGRATSLDELVARCANDAQGWQVGQPMRPPSGRPAVAS